MNITGVLVVFAVAVCAFGCGWYAARLVYIDQWLKAREVDALKRQRELKDAKRRYPPRDGSQPVIIRKARILGDPKNIDS